MSATPKTKWTAKKTVKENSIEQIMVNTNWTQVHLCQICHIEWIIKWTVRTNYCVYLIFYFILFDVTSLHLYFCLILYCYDKSNKKARKTYGVAVLRKNCETLRPAKVSVKKNNFIQVKIVVRVHFSVYILKRADTRCAISHIRWALAVCSNIIFILCVVCDLNVEKWLCSANEDMHVPQCTYTRRKAHANTSIHTWGHW